MKTLNRILPLKFPKTLLTFFILFFAIWKGPEYAQGEPLLIDRIVAVVNQEVITLSELQESAMLAYRQKSLSKTGEEQDPLDQNSLRVILEKEIDKRLQLQEARKKGIFLSETELETALGDIKARNGFVSNEIFAQALAKESLTLEQYKNDLRDQLTILKLVNREISSSMTLEEEKLKEFYEQNQHLFAGSPRIQVRQILLKIGSPEESQEKMKLAEKIVEQIHQGSDFIDMVDQYSEGPEKTRGGDLGYFKSGELMSPLNETAFSLSVGEVSTPIQSSLGIHILQISKNETDPYKPFEEVKGELGEKLIQIKSEEFHHDWLRELRLHAHVAIKF
jgi:peptidyl-prolyl cis-trans isomerase SurA